MNLIRKRILPFTGITAALLLLAWSDVSWGDSNAEDRAAIENLMGRYLFALDFRDADAYAATFTEDGILNHGGGLARGRREIREVVIRAMETDKKQADGNKSGRRPVPGRHNITNIVLDVRGNRATAKAYWTHFGADNEGRARPTSFGHYQDELVKQNGQWLFSRRVIFNEFRDGRQYGVLNPDSQ